VNLAGRRTTAILAVSLISYFMIAPMTSAGIAGKEPA
jgi:hypothetical protein